MGIDNLNDEKEKVKIVSNKPVKTAKELALIMLEEMDKRNISSTKELQKLKHELSRQYKCNKFPSNIELLCYGNKEQYQKYRTIITGKPTRTLSGVTPIAVMAKPINCPHGKCVYCPGGIGSEFGDVPQSYTGKEPSTMRAIRANYDPYVIVFNRIEQFLVLGHEVEKIDIIIQSGTFTSFPKKYREDFVYKIFKAMNDFSDMFFNKQTKELDFDLFKLFFDVPANMGDEKHSTMIRERMAFFRDLDVLKISREDIIEFVNGNEEIISDLKTRILKSTLKDEHTRNDFESIVKCVGMTIETKPDWGRKEHGEYLLEYGVTRIELGIQSVYDDVLKFVNRGHTAQESKDSIRELKDQGFKLNFHYMPGLISDYDKDLEGMKQLFTDPEYTPDMIKIYPCMVMPGTPLYDMYKKGEFTPIKTDTAVKMISEFMEHIPPYCRVMRVQRDIPTYQTTAGVDKTNLRQLVDNYMTKYGIKSKEIRSIESGRTENTGEIRLEVLEYDSSKSKDYFVSIVDDSSIYGFARLRFPSDNSENAFIRELHVYGRGLKVGDKGDSSVSQHRGFGKKLMAEAEKICKEHNKKKLLVISGVGVRGYYRKLGFELEGTYMVKDL